MQKNPWKNHIYTFKKNTQTNTEHRCHATAVARSVLLLAVPRSVTVVPPEGQHEALGTGDERNGEASVRREAVLRHVEVGMSNAIYP